MRIAVGGREHRAVARQAPVTQRAPGGVERLQQLGIDPDRAGDERVGGAHQRVRHPAAGDPVEGRQPTSGAGRHRHRQAGDLRGHELEHPAPE